MTRGSRSLIALSLVTLLSACASTEEGASKMVAINDPPDPDEVTCKTVVKTGTRLNTRVCQTNRAWDQQATDAREAATLIQTQSKQGPGPE